ncbi:unnamed protein product [Cuscuta campestris]|uniref:Uncharacterized protein n=1 Tax=Cuscuta campestris TaxID=132261 RepID=A0A484MHJ6_9ASTE|nr:unnamed protein product [Cuscuta campestris]
MDLSSVILGTSSTPLAPAISLRRVSLPPASVRHRRIAVRASVRSNQIPTISTLKSAGVALIFAAVTLGKFPQAPIARAEAQTLTVAEGQPEATVLESEAEKADSLTTESSESSEESIEALSKLLQQKLEAGEDEDGLKLLDKLAEAQPENREWKLLKARLYNEMGKVQESRTIFEEILSENPLWFEALFENALLMDRCGERDNVIHRLEEALKVAMEEGKSKEARDVRFIMAQMMFLHKNVEEALTSYEELAREDPKDFRPYFCKGMIYSLLGRNEEAVEQFNKYRELSPKKFEVEGYLRTPLSRLRMIGTDE